MLGELEATVLESLWEHGEPSTRAVYEIAGTRRGLAYTTILTVLQRLTKKGLLSRRATGGRTHLYTPTVTRERLAEWRADTLASALVGLGNVGLAAFLTEVRRLDPEVVARLRRRLSKKP